ncbi:MAG: pectate lyase [Ignavibacteriaceae bacterium]
MDAQSKIKFLLLISFFMCTSIFTGKVLSQQNVVGKNNFIDVSGFDDCAHHWKDITDHEQFIMPLPGQKRYKPSQVKEIADNILLYQQKNGGWPKNYDMLAILTKEQKDIISKGKDSNNTTFDNGATHSQVKYLAKAYTLTKDKRYSTAALRGIDFILRAQYPNGGWPQFYPDTRGYRKYITFNDDAMTGVMNVLHNITQNNPDYSFVNRSTREKANIAFEKGIECILKCQIVENGEPTVWCQQHDNIDFSPRGARTFELPSKCGEESSDIVLLLMSINHPSKAIINSIKGAVKWFKDSRIYGIREMTIKAPKVVYKFRTSVTDRIVIKYSTAPPVWARYYALGTNIPFFCDRNGIPVDSLSKVGRERRDGYTWYNYAPQHVLDVYPLWLKKIEGKN